MYTNQAQEAMVVLVLEYKAKVKKNQIKAIEEAIRTTQFVRNKCLRYWMDCSKEDKVNAFALNKYSTRLRKEFPFVKQLNSMAVQASAERAWFAISRFFDRCKSNDGRKKGFPRFQRNNRSVEYKTSGWKLHPTKRRITFTDKKGIGELKLLGKWDIHTFPSQSIKRVRIVRRADGYYVQFSLNMENQIDVPKATSEVGIDVGLEYFYSDSNGHNEENPRFLRKAEQDIKRVQRQIYKKKKGSTNRQKARGKYARKHLRVTRRRNEHAKRLARNVCLANAKIALEDLNVSGLVKNHKLAKSISDASWYNFRQWLEYFGKKFGREVVAVPPHYTSQECSNCGAKVEKSLSTRTHSCPRCGYTEQRDVNAAKVILSRATTGGQPGSNA